MIPIQILWRFLVIKNDTYYEYWLPNRQFFYLGGANIKAISWCCLYLMATPAYSFCVILTFVCISECIHWQNFPSCYRILKHDLPKLPIPLLFAYPSKARNTA